MEFTDIHDLSVDYLLGRLIESQHAAIAAVEACVAGLARQPAALALGQEILGNLRGHLENFQAAARSLAARPASVAPRPSPLASSS